MNIYDIFDALEKLDVKGVINGEVVNFYDMRYGSIMLVHENNSIELPLGKLKPPTVFTIYSEESNKMIRLHLDTSKVDNESLIISQIHYNNGKEEYIIDLERFGLNIRIYKKIDSNCISRSEITLRDNESATFVINNKVGFYNKQFVDCNTLSIDEIIFKYSYSYYDGLL